MFDDIKYSALCGFCDKNLMHKGRIVSMHVMNRLYQEGFDFPFRDAPPRMHYMLATIPRSGSTYFALKLWRTGGLGAPMEYANPPYISMLKNRLSVDLDIISYWREIERRRTSPNGVFGYKMFIKNYLQCEDEYIDLMTKLAPNKVVFLTRRDVVAQAISLSKALQSKAWFHGVEVECKPKYSYGEVKNNVNQIEQEIVTWHRIFDLTDAEVLPVFYEDLLETGDKTVYKVSEFLGVKLDSSMEINIPAIEIQRTPESIEWANKYHEDFARDTVASSLVNN